MNDTTGFITDEVVGGFITGVGEGISAREVIDGLIGNGVEG